VGGLGHGRRVQRSLRGRNTGERGGGTGIRGGWGGTLSSMSEKIVVFEVTEVEKIDGHGFRDDPVRGPTRSSAKAGAAVRAIAVDVEQLSDNFVGFVENVRSMLARVSDVAGEFSVEKVEIQAQISGEGKVGFVGSGVKAGGEASIKLVLERRKDPKSPA
jgi:hypothetical protein